MYAGIDTILGRIKIILEQYKNDLPQGMDTIDSPWHVFHVINISSFRIENLNRENIG